MSLHKKVFKNKCWKIADWKIKSSMNSIGDDYFRLKNLMFWFKYVIVLWLLSDYTKLFKISYPYLDFEKELHLCNSSDVLQSLSVSLLKFALFLHPLCAIFSRVCKRLADISWKLGRNEANSNRKMVAPTIFQDTRLVVVHSQCSFSVLVENHLVKCFQSKMKDSLFLVEIPLERIGSSYDLLICNGGRSAINDQTDTRSVESEIILH